MDEALEHEFIRGVRRYEGDVPGVTLAPDPSPLPIGHVLEEWCRRECDQEATAQPESRIAIYWPKVHGLWPGCLTSEQNPE
jgi:hypothetical protein